MVERRTLMERRAMTTGSAENGLFHMPTTCCNDTRFLVCGVYLIY